MAAKSDLEDFLILAGIAAGLWFLWRAWEEANATEAAGALGPYQGAQPATPAAPPAAGASPSAGLPFPSQPPPQSLGSDVLNAIIPQTISPAGRAFIKRQESLTLTPKPEPNGGREIGWGHYIAPGDTWQGTITPDQAEELFDHDVGEAEDVINANVKVALSQNQFDALGSLAFNVPEALGPKSGVVLALNAGNYAKAAQEIARWNKIHQGGQVTASTGLTKRRQAEQKLFNTPDANAAAGS
jgi:lysozyme